MYTLRIHVFSFLSSYKEIPLPIVFWSSLLVIIDFATVLAELIITFIKNRVLCMDYLKFVWFYYNLTFVFK